MDAWLNPKHLPTSPCIAANYLFKITFTFIKYSKEGD